MPGGEAPALMDVLVTGGTGFVGANLVRELIGDGHRVRVLARKGGDRRALEGCSVDIAEGDLLDVDSVRAAVAGARRVYHVAADYRLWAPDPRALYRANVDGTRHVLEAAALAGVERIVYTSTVGAVGIPRTAAPVTSGRLSVSRTWWDRTRPPSSSPSASPRSSPRAGRPWSR